MKTRIKFQEESIARNFMETNAKMRKKTLKHKIKFGVQKRICDRLFINQTFHIRPKVAEKMRQFARRIYNRQYLRR